MSPKIKPGLAALALLVSTTCSAQQISKKEFTKLFSSDSVSWAIPCINQEAHPVRWTRQESSFDADGTRTYVAKVNEEPVGTLAINEDGSIMGMASLDKDYIISFNGEEMTVDERTQKKTGCGVERKPLTRTSFDSEIFKADAPFHDGVFREYRLAAVFSKQEFESKLFNRDIGKMRAYVAALETFLNSIYVRDMGIHFTMVKNDKLLLSGLDYNQMGEVLGTGIINKIIGEDAYDVGVQFVYPGDDINPGVSKAVLGGITQRVWKGNVMVQDQIMWTAGHELCHLFGGQHTFEIGSEPNPGQSIVSYGHFYKYICKSTMQEMLLNLKRADARLKAEGINNTYTAQNHAPRIDRTRMRTEYVIPNNTFFEIPVYASDPDGDPLYYGRQEEGYFPYKHAHFPTISPTRDNVMRFGRTYNEGNLLVTPGTATVPVGEHKMSFYVNDVVSLEDAIARKKAPLYDVFTTTLKVIDAKPFKITTPMDKIYKPGQRLKLTWDVDKSFFHNDSKVEIRMSMDCGKTYPYVLIPETANDGECEIIMPNLEVGEIGTYGIDTEDGQHIDIFKTAKGVIKLRTLDRDIFFDITDNSLKDGGFQVKKPSVIFQNAPEERITAHTNTAAIPAKDAVTAKTNDGRQLKVSYREEKDMDWTHRIWTVQDNGEEVSVDQFVHTKNATGIHQLNSNGTINDEHIYNLAGQRIEKPQQGIYIQGGKKKTVSITR